MFLILEIPLIDPLGSPQDEVAFVGDFIDGAESALAYFLQHIVIVRELFLFHFDELVPFDLDLHHLDLVFLDDDLLIVLKHDALGVIGGYLIFGDGLIHEGFTFFLLKLVVLLIVDLWLDFLKFRLGIAGSILLSLFF